MRVEQLEIDAFRSLKGLSITPTEGVNVIWGENGRGKTNLIEAIWMFTGARSFRGARDAELVPFGSTFARATLRFYGAGRQQEAALTFGERKRARLNGVALESAQALSGSFYAVVFSPAHLSLIKGGPTERRSVIDTMICQLKPRYLPLLNQYGRLLTQRNSLLKAIRTAGGMIETLDVWDSALAKAGTLIQTTRESYVKRLAPFAQEVYHGIARGREAVSFAYRKAGFDAESDLAALLAQTRADDLRIGSTTVGPHRDDLEVLIDGVSARAYGSQGQQRSAVLALKLGECALIEEVAQEQPVVLLDDVMSELDDSRRDYLLHRLGDRQIFITCCDPRQIQGVESRFEMKSAPPIGGSQ